MTDRDGFTNRAQRARAEIPSYGKSVMSVMGGPEARQYERAATMSGRSDGTEATMPSAAALRMRRHRERRREGLRCMTIELRETEVSALIRKGFLNEAARNDRRAVFGAFYGFLDRRLDS
jgi:hypothetical protein